FEPGEPGAGGLGGGSAFDPGGSGGGVLRLMAQGPLVIDGAIAANGVPGTHSVFTANGGGGGAGGSVRLAAPSLAGRGVVQADGATSGGGGRVALYIDAIDAGMLPRVTAYG